MALFVKHRLLPYPCFHSKVSGPLHCTQHILMCLADCMPAREKDINSVPISLFDFVKRFKLNDKTSVEQKHEPMLKCTITY